MYVLYDHIISIRKTMTRAYCDANAVYQSWRTEPFPNCIYKAINHGTPGIPFSLIPSQMIEFVIVRVVDWLSVINIKKSSLFVLMWVVVQ